MKKILGICICLVLFVAAITAPAAFAAESTSGAAVTIHFLNPTAIAYVNGKLFVADNIDDNNSAIHCFDVSGSTTTRLYTQSLTEKIVNLSAKDDSSLYVVFDNKIVEYTVSDTKLTEKATISGYANPVDVTYGADLDGRNEYVLTDNALYRKNGSGTANSEAITGTKSCIAIGNYIYYLYTSDNGVDLCKCYDGSDRSTPNGTTAQGYLNNSDPTASNYYLKDFGAQGLIVWENDKVAVFNKKQISYVNMAATCTLSPVFDYHASQAEAENKKDIVDVAVSANRIYLLNDSFQVDIFEKSDNDYTLISTVGDDTVYQSVPTAYTSFTLVRPKRYPTNLVYKTSDESTTVDDLIKNATEYIIVGFEGDATSNYYYVLVGDKFGWVQKSEGATSPSTDGNLTIVNTSVSNDYVDVTTYFNSLNAVYVYPLPRENSQPYTFTQTQNTKPEVKVLQKFTEATANGNIVWNYVSFVDNGNTVFGFVKQEHVGKYTAKINSGVATQQKKINSTIFEAVKVYEDAEMTVACTTENSPNGVKLYSGQRVTLIYEEGGVAYVQILNGDGSQILGFVQSSRLIDVNAMTTNAIVGLSLLAVAVALATTLIIIFVKRKNGSLPKRKKEVKSEEQ